MARILICDDSPVIRMKLRDVLEDAGHEIVDEAASVHESVEMYKKHKPDLTTMDLVMDRTGAEAIKTIKQFDPEAKIVIFSTLGPDVINAVKLGALSIVAKSEKEGALLAEINRVLGQ